MQKGGAAPKAVRRKTQGTVIAKPPKPGPYGSVGGPPSSDDDVLSGSESDAEKKETDLKAMDKLPDNDDEEEPPQEPPQEILKLPWTGPTPSRDDLGGPRDVSVRIEVVPDREKSYRECAY